MTLLGTAEVDCLLRLGDTEARSRGDKEREESERSAAADGERLLDPCRELKRVPPLLKGSVTALGRCRGRPATRISTET
jgi:hypothetical protein